MGREKYRSWKEEKGLEMISEVDKRERERERESKGVHR